MIQLHWMDILTIKIIIVVCVVGIVWLVGKYVYEEL